MDAFTVYITCAGAFFIILCLALAGILSAYINPSEAKVQQVAIKEALDHLADVARTGLARDPDRDALEKKLTAIMEIKEYPGKGNVGEWEAKTALLV